MPDVKIVGPTPVPAEALLCVYVCAPTCVRARCVNACMRACVPQSGMS